MIKKIYVHLILICLMAEAIRAESVPQPRIAIIGLYDPGYRHIGKYSDRNKKIYARQHGYDLHLYHKSLDESRPTAWSKILAILNHIDQYDWIYWSDSDKLIMNINTRLEKFIDHNYDLIITREATQKNLNTGSFLIKNSEWSKQLLHDIYAQTQCINDFGFWEQRALEQLLKAKPELLKRIKILPQRAMNSHPSEPGGIYRKGDFAIHFYGPMPKVQLMKHYYREFIKAYKQQHVRKK